MGIKPDILDAWIAKLLSGDYGQAHGVLQAIDEDGSAENRYCCLGLCDLALGINYEEQHLIKDDVEQSRTIGTSGLTPTCQDVLAAANDAWKFTFQQIADMLQAERESLIRLGTFPRDWWEDHKDALGHGVSVRDAIHQLEQVELRLAVDRGDYQA